MPAAYVKVRLKKGTYYFDLLPDGMFTKNPVPHPAGKIIPARPKDAIELVSLGKAEYVKEAPPAVKSDGVRAETMDEGRKILAANKTEKLSK